MQDQAAMRSATCGFTPWKKRNSLHPGSCSFLSFGLSSAGIVHGTVGGAANEITQGIL